MADGLLVLDRMTMRFGGLVALDVLDLVVRRGEILGLIGPNGSGKTTCFNVVTGIYAPSDGKVTFDELMKLPPTTTPITLPHTCQHSAPTNH